MKVATSVVVFWRLAAKMASGPGLMAGDVAVLVLAAAVVVAVVKGF